MIIITASFPTRICSHFTLTHLTDLSRTDLEQFINRYLKILVNNTAIYMINIIIISCCLTIIACLSCSFQKIHLSYRQEVRVFYSTPCIIIQNHQSSTCRLIHHQLERIARTGRISTGNDI